MDLKVSGDDDDNDGEAANFLSLTQQFRQDVLSIAVDYSRRDSAQLPQFIARCIVPKLPSSEDQAIVAEHDLIEYACRECGHPIRPGHDSAKIRVARPPTLSESVRRTLRRRMLRQHKKDLARSRMQAKVSQNHPSKRKKKTQNDDPEDRGSILPTTFILHGKTMDRQLLLDKHYLSLSCGHCSCKVKLPGLKQQRPANAKKKAHQEQTPPPPPRKAPKRKAENAKMEESLEFIPLPTEVEQPATIDASLNSRNKKSKKKKKSTEMKGGKLMEFLSNLNG